MSGVAIVHPEYGIFVGVGLGLAFWSNIDCVGQTQAPLIPDEAQARAFVDSWCNSPGADAFTYHPVTSADPTFATIEELDAAGLVHLTAPMKSARMGPAQGTA